MSAFMCSKETLARITDYLMGSDYYIWLRENNLINNKDDCDNLFDKLWELNEKAIFERYDEGIANTMVDMREKVYIPKIAPEELHHVVKMLDCFLYQCAEANIDKERLYIILKLIRDDICINKIVREDPKYQEYIWG